jgi:MATE family, multidrug efflux pump
VALGFAVSPVAGQNVGARKPDRVSSAFKSAMGMAVSLMVGSAIGCYTFAAQLMSVFSHDLDVIAIGVEYLHVVAWSFVASGVVFVSSSMFQALGNTIPPLLSSFSRIVLIAIPVVILSRLPGFHLTWIWYLSVTGVTLQMVANLLLLRREFRLRFDTPPAVVNQPSLSA